MPSVPNEGLPPSGDYGPERQFIASTVELWAASIGAQLMVIHAVILPAVSDYEAGPTRGANMPTVGALRSMCGNPR